MIIQSINDNEEVKWNININMIELILMKCNDRNDMNNILYWRKCNNNINNNIMKIIEIINVCKLIIIWNDIIKKKVKINMNNDNNNENSNVRKKMKKMIICNDMKMNNNNNNEINNMKEM